MRDPEKKRKSDLAYYHRHSKEFRLKRNQANLKRQKLLDAELDKVFGKSCVISGKTDMLEIHEIHGKNHVRGAGRKKFYLEHPEDFTRINKFYHRAIHLLRDLTPEQRAKLLKFVEQS